MAMSEQNKQVFFSQIFFRIFPNFEIFSWFSGIFAYFSRISRIFYTDLEFIGIFSQFSRYFLDICLHFPCIYRDTFTLSRSL